MKKKVDTRIQILIENVIKLRQRGFFIIVGDRGRDQVVNLYYLMSQQTNKAKPNILWCFKKDLGFSSHKRKRAKQIKKLQSKGLYNNEVDDPFDLFITSTEIRYCYYKETHNILGNTYAMLILQDFESITPNILCRTIETVEGGGMVILLIKTMTSLKQLYTISMDVHQRFRTPAHQDIEPRFNERFLLSLSICKNCIIMDDEMNILPIYSSIKEISPVSTETSTNLKMLKELDSLKDSMKGNLLLGPLVKIAKTLDQAKAVMMFFESINEKNFRCTVSLTAARGRGKSAAIGISIAAAIACGYSNIFVTAPSPENLKTLFNFVFEGLEALNYKENLHYEIIQSTNPDLNKAVIRVNVFKSHRQFIQYIFPTDTNHLGQADLLVIDEAAAIPLPYVRKLLGPYMVFLSSTINGYEGTGRSLSLKLIQKLKEQNKMAMDQGISKSSSGARILKEITLNDPIRYSFNDPMESWLNDLLLLNATNAEPLSKGLPHPNDCDLYLVNRDTLFSYHKASEKFLASMMSLFISSHYKNSPNDLQMISDHPAIGLFILMGPLGKEGSKKAEEGGKTAVKNEIPDILCVVQICLEGEIAKEKVSEKRERAIKPAGDLIPWTISEQYQDPEFPSLSGARVVRIATHPAAQKMGYGSRALELLTKFFEGQLIDLSNEEIVMEDFFLREGNRKTTIEEEDADNSLKPKKKMKPLMKKLSEVRPPHLHYLGVSYGLTRELFRYWRKNAFLPVYLRQTKNDLTAEHSCIMIKSLNNEDADVTIKDPNWTNKYTEDFKKRFMSLLSYEFRDLEVSVSLGILDPNLTTNPDTEEARPILISKNEISHHINLFDLRRLEAYSKNMVDYHLILDLLPTIARLFFLNKFSKNVRLVYTQAAILIGMGLQHKPVDVLTTELNIPASQILAQFNKTIRKVAKEVATVYEREMEKLMPEKAVKDTEMLPLKQTLDSDVEEDGNEIIEKLEKKSKNTGPQKKRETDSEANNLKRKAKYSVQVGDLTEKQIFDALSGGKSDLVIPRKQVSNESEDINKEVKKKRKL